MEKTKFMKKRRKKIRKRTKSMKKEKQKTWKNEIYEEKKKIRKKNTYV